MVSFFKTGPGQYAEHDRFLGIKVPVLRILAKELKDLGLNDLQVLIESPYNESRLLALIILTKHPSPRDFYLKNLKYVNNWNLVDTSAHLILGVDLDLKLLKKLAHSSNLWERRIAMVATWMPIRQNNFEPTIEIAKILLNDSHDLIHKAVGWMLREMGKKDLSRLIQFLDRYYKTMPRIMLRYAIEKLPKKQRLAYLSGDCLARLTK